MLRILKFLNVKNFQEKRLHLFGVRGQNKGIFLRDFKESPSSSYNAFITIKKLRNNRYKQQQQQFSLLLIMS